MNDCKDFKIYFIRENFMKAEVKTSYM